MTIDEYAGEVYLNYTLIYKNRICDVLTKNFDESLRKVYFKNTMIYRAAFPSSLDVYISIRFSPVYLPPIL